ncbi:ASCH domain-containing protein [Paucisalibacillus globulus]|uniref:ASCH domain-containing protein n=1 Tax=Paucisalibacillus globulus TaxID=351095 RepID=UPI000BB72B5D|nr:ASCH domain-containing protein [Paucisalibacillus globulus]
MNKESVLEIWEAYKKTNPNAPDKYEAWAFGNSKELADKLLGLVLEGTKTATASNYNYFGGDNEPLPQVGDLSIILNGDGEAVAIIETTSIDIVPFDEVTEEFAYLEGEGDRSLRYWREVHEWFFKTELEGTDEEFHDKLPIVCEEFRVVYKK